MLQTDSPKGLGQPNSLKQNAIFTAEINVVHKCENGRKLRVNGKLHKSCMTD